MRSSILLAAVTLAAVTLAAHADPRPNALVSPDGRLTWWAHRDDPNVMLLFDGDRLVGVLDPAAGSWRWTYEGRPLDMVSAVSGRREGRGRPAGAVLPAQVPPGASPARPRAAIEESSEPVPPPLKPKSATDDKLVSAGPAGQPGPTNPVDGSPRGGPDYRTGGVDLSKLRSQPRYQIGGREVGPAEALSAIQKGAVPDDATHVRLTVIGGKGVCDRVSQDLQTAPELAYWKDKLVVNCYRPDHWRVKDGGFATNTDPARPSIYVQAHDGKVLWRQESYTGPAELAKALRDRVPGYDPARDPNPRAAPDGVAGRVNPVWLTVPAALVLVVLGLVVSAGVHYVLRKRSP